MGDAKNAEMAPDLNNKSFIEHLIGGRPVSAWTSLGACAAGDNMAGSVLALKITFAEKPPQDEQKLHLIYKQIPQNPPDWIIQGQIFRKEHAVYRTIVPSLEAFSASRSHPYSSPLPAFYKGFNNDKNDYILIEDVRPKGYRMLDKRQTLTFPEMSLILTELATFHATSYAFLRHEGTQILDLEGDHHPDFKTLARNLFPKNPDSPDRDLYDDLIQLYFSTSADLITQEIPELGPRIAKIINPIQTRKHAMTNPAYFQTIIHSDLWTNNLLIKYNDDKIPVSVKFIDFQLTQMGNIFSDLGYLLYTSTTPEFRKAYLLPALGTYYDQFSSTLKSLGCPLPLGFSLGFLLDEFAACRLSFLIHMTFAVPLQLGDMVGVEAEWEEKNKNNIKDNDDDGNKDKKKDEGGEMEGPLGSGDGIKQMIIQSPIALQRLKDLFQEAASQNVI